MENQGLIVDWEKIHLFNSLMSIAAGAAFFSLRDFFKVILNPTERFNARSFALGFGVVGTILLITGAYTTLTWPLSPTYPFDNIIFGEPCFVFGCLLLALSFYCWTDQKELMQLAKDFPNDLGQYIIGNIAQVKYMILIIGLSVIMLGLSGIVNGLFIAPPEEPIVSAIDQVIPWATTLMIGLSWISVGIAAIAIYNLMRHMEADQSVKQYKWLINFLFFLAFNFAFIGIITYYTHIGMVVNTMDPSTIQPNVIRGK